MFFPATTGMSSELPMRDLRSSLNSSKPLVPGIWMSVSSMSLITSSWKESSSIAITFCGRCMESSNTTSSSSIFSSLVGNGNMTVNVEPHPSLLFTSIVPLSKVTRPFVIVKPSQTPSVFLSSVARSKGR